MLVRVHMHVLVGVLDADRVQGNNDGCHDHDGCRQEELPGHVFSQHDKAKENADERADGVESRCLCSTQMSLRHDIQLDGQAKGECADDKLSLIHI